VVLPERDATASGEEWAFAEGDEIVPGRHALRLLGSGRLHEAYLAFDERLHSLVVAKVLRPSVVGDPGAISSLAAEARIVRSLGHPVVLRCFDAVLAGSRPHLVLEFLEGPRLSTLLRKYGPVALEQVLPLGLELCSALHYLAGEGVVHLDVKPRNVIMGGPPRLIDFSIARGIDQAARLNVPVGTDAYMAPEQCDPERLGPVGPPADVWGLGVTMYEALTRSLPFPPLEGDASSPARRFPQLLGTPKPFPDEIPPPVGAVVLSCLEPRPDDRPTAAEAAGALEPLVALLPRPRLIAWKPR
jgi:eukaryotic-like serine/threonine-protein kinase